MFINTSVNTYNSYFIEAHMHLLSDTQNIIYWKQTFKIYYVYNVINPVLDR